jgi:hypothetical protein
MVPVVRHGRGVTENIRKYRNIKLHYLGLIAGLHRYNQK